MILGRSTSVNHQKGELSRELMSRAPLPLLLVFLMLTTPLSNLSSQDTNIESMDGHQLPEGESLFWSADEAAEFWSPTSPVRMLEAPLKESSHEIHTVFGSFDPTKHETPLPPEPFRDHFDVENTRYIIVQLVEHDRFALEDFINRLGIVDLDYIPDDSYLLRIPADSEKAAIALEEISNHPLVRAVIIQHPGWRVHPDLIKIAIDSIDRQVVPLIDLDITPAGDLSSLQLEGLQSDLIKTGANEVRCDAWLCQVIEINPSWLEVLANDGRILFTEPHNKIVITNNYARDLIRVDEVINNHNSGLDGTGEVAAISDSGLDGDHGDFTGRLLTIYSNYGPDSSGADTNSGHGTHVAGSMLGDGSGDSSYAGVAPATTFHFYQLEHDQSGQMARWGSLYDMFRHSRQQSASVQSNSWGAENMGGQYTPDSRSADAFMDDYGDYTVLFAAGNEGTQAH